MAGFDKVDPSHACLGRCARPRRVWARSAHDGPVDLPPYREMQERWLDEGVSVVLENVVHQRTKVLRKLRVLKP